MKKVAVIVGSIAKESLNRKVAKGIESLMPEGFEFEYIQIAELPLYTQDRDSEPPASYVALREQIKSADAVLFVTPEHNRSFPAALKNAIDICSRPYGQNVFDGKLAAVVSASPGAIGGFGANHHLRQVLAYLNMRVMGQPEAYVGAAHKVFDAEGNFASEDTKKFLGGFASAFAKWIS